MKFIDLATWMVLLATLSGCLSTTDPFPPLPERYRQEGLVTSNTYQMQLVVAADNKMEAAQIAGAKARHEVLVMILKEPSLHFSISPYGKSKLEKLIQKNGMVVYATQKTEENWIVIYQVYKKGLWDYLRKLQ